MEPTVLVIDDSSMILDTISIMLEGCGYTVVSRPSPEDALDLCEQVHFDLIICDMCFDTMNNKYSLTRGLDAVIALCRRYPDRPVIAMSGFLRDADLKALEAVGVAATLSKPFRMDELLAAIEKANEVGKYAA